MSSAHREPLRLGLQERLVSSCTYIGGAYLSLQQGSTVDLAFRDEALEIYDYPSGIGFTARETLLVPVQGLTLWATEHRAEMQESRRKFDKKLARRKPSASG